MPDRNDVRIGTCDYLQENLVPSALCQIETECQTAREGILPERFSQSGPNIYTRNYLLFACHPSSQKQKSPGSQDATSLRLQNISRTLLRLPMMQVTKDAWCRSGSRIELRGPPGVVSFAALQSVIPVEGCP